MPLPLSMQKNTVCKNRKLVEIQKNRVYKTETETERTK